LKPGARGAATASPAEHHLSVTRTARYYTLGEPSADCSEVWFVLHGFGQLAGYFVRFFAPLAAAGRLIVAPEALSRFYVGEVDGRTGRESRVGATWMTREDRLAEIADYVGYLDALYDETFRSVDKRRARALALGFSQGAETACRWVSHGRARLDRLVLWAGKLAPELESDEDFRRFRELKLTVVLGRDDPFGDEAMLAALRDRLARHGVSHELVRFNGGHALDADTLLALSA
jgi:dienelactone hydrolase